MRLYYNNNVERPYLVRPVTNIVTNDPSRIIKVIVSLSYGFGTFREYRGAISKVANLSDWINNPDLPKLYTLLEIIKIRNYYANLL